MYGSVDNSWNDCINEKNLIIKNNKSYIAARDQIASAQMIHRLVPRANTIVHVCDRIDAGELKGWSRGWSNLDSFRPE